MPERKDSGAWIEMPEAQWDELMALGHKAMGVDVSPSKVERKDGVARVFIPGAVGLLIESLAKVKKQSPGDMLLELAKKADDSQGAGLAEKKTKSQEVIKQFLDEMPQPSEVFLIGVEQVSDTILHTKRDFTIAIGGSASTLAEVIQSLCDAYAELNGTQYAEIIGDCGRKLKAAFKENGVEHSEMQGEINAPLPRTTLN